MAILRVYNPLTESWDPIPYIKGDKGDRGYDVTTVEYEYYSSTSSSETIGGEWSTIMPGYSVGRYIWVRTKTTNTHGEVYTGTPVLATLFNDVNSAELTRRTYETNRVNAETARDTAEGLRDSAEIARASAELLRVSAETSRGNSEVSRANAEAQRVSAESSRVSVEAQRVANEEQRISNENTRIAAQGRYPIVQNNTWWVWSKEDDDYVDTEVTAVGADGVGIASIELTSTADLVDTYTITFDDGSTTTFDVTNGADGISPTITVTEITGGHNVEITDAQGTTDFDVMDGEVSEEELETALIDKADVITSTASGEIVTISDGGNDLPVVDLKLSLLPVQSGSGDPSPTNIRPISGWTGVDVTHTGENLLGGVNLAETFRGCVSFALDTTNKTFNYGRSKNSVLYGVKWKPNTRYTFIWTFTAQSRNNSLYVRYTDGTSEQFLICESTTNKNTIVARTASGKTVRNFYLSYSQWGTVTVYYDESGVFEGVLTASDFKPYVGTTYPIDWTSSAGTVYGGSLDLTTGVLKVEWVEMLFNGTQTVGLAGWRPYDDSSAWLYRLEVTPNIERAWKSDYTFYIMSDTLKSIPYAAGDGGVYGDNIGISLTGDSTVWGVAMRVPVSGLDTATKINDYLAQNPIDVVYKLTQPITFQLSENQIATFLGVNNFWSNSNGQIDLEYRCDTKLYIENLTKPSEDDMTANQNITSGSFFMVGNRLFLSTVAIAQGATIIPGTNCTEISLADALNSLNS